MKGALAIVAALAAPALAGPEWVEGKTKEDAGSLPADAQITLGAGPLESIRGKLDGAANAVGFGDFQDLFVIELADPTSFQATTTFNGGSAAFEGYLWLFQVDGLPLLGNLLTDGFASELGFVGATLTNTATDQTGLVVEQPGIYIVGISAAPTMPFSVEGPLFVFAEPTEVSGPDGEGANAPLSMWDFDPGAVGPVGGEYVIALNAVEFGAEGACCVAGSCVETTFDACEEMGGSYLGDLSTCATERCPAPCVADVTGPGGTPDGNVDAVDFLLLIAEWGTPCTLGCATDITGPLGVPDGSVDALDFLLLIGQWGSPGNC
jgi:hypothetical protein